MAKQLPYFKFNVAEFLLGRISTESNAVKGIFIDVCSHYWHKECDITRLELNAKIGKKNAQVLIDKGYVNSDGLNSVSIPFLDEQFNELSDYQQKRSIAGKKGRLSQLGQTLNNRQANAEHLYKEEDKIRKEEDKKALLEIWFQDLENSAHLETIADLHKTTVEDIKSFFPAFRVKAELSYLNYDRFISHFKNLVNTEKNARTKPNKNDRQQRISSINNLENLAEKVLGGDQS